MPEMQTYDPDIINFQEEACLHSNKSDIKIIWGIVIIRQVAWIIGPPFTNIINKIPPGEITMLTLIS